jgi:glycosyltransferase involved in cell wall biosynthesis
VADPPLVLVDARMARRRSSGVATYVRELRAAVEALAPPDLRIEWLMGPPGLPQRNRLTSVGNLVLDLVWTHVWIPLVALARKADVVHATFNWAPWWAPCAKVVTVQDVSWEVRPADYPPGFRAYARLFTRRSARSSHVVITPSRATAHDVARFYRVPEARIRVVPLGTHPSPAGPAPREPMVLSVGVLHRRKRIVELVEGHRLYRAEAPPSPPPCRLVVVGGPAGDEDAVARAAGPDCELRGFVSRAELDGLYDRASLLVFPSAYEGFGIPVLEAMAHGCPVLVARNSSLPEVAGDSGHYLDDPSPQGIARALRDLLADRDALAASGEFARAASRVFTWEATAEATLAAYRAAAGA